MYSWTLLKWQKWSCHKWVTDILTLCHLQIVFIYSDASLKASQSAIRQRFCLQQSRTVSEYVGKDSNSGNSRIGSWAQGCDVITSPTFETVSVDRDRILRTPRPRRRWVPDTALTMSTGARSTFATSKDLYYKVSPWILTWPPNKTQTKVLKSELLRIHA